MAVQLRYLRCSLNLISLSVERPTLSRPPDSPSGATRLRALERHHAEVRYELDRFRGEEIDTAGDGFFALFDGPARAIRCAVETRDPLRGLGLDMRAGVHTGEVERRGGDKPRGIAVHVGSRVAASAGAGEVLVTATTRDLVAGAGLELEDGGQRQLQGIPEASHLFGVR
jgi:class 3 adenylate cyclase